MKIVDVKLVSLTWEKKNLPTNATECAQPLRKYTGQLLLLSPSSPLVICIQDIPSKPSKTSQFLRLILSSSLQSIEKHIEDDVIPSVVR